MAICNLFGGGSSPPPPPPPSLEYQIVSAYQGKPVMVSANMRFGAAIYSLRHDGFEYLDSTDHGRELQTAWQLDGMGEAQNPTEAGSAADGAGPISSTRVLLAKVEGLTLTTRCNPAYWYPYQGVATSPHILEKYVTLDGNVLTHNIGMFMEPGHTMMAMEGLTAYTTQVFTRFFTFDYGGGNLTELFPEDSKLIMSSSPVMLTTADQSRAIALVSADRAHKHWIGHIGPWPKLDASWFTAVNPGGWVHWKSYTIFGSMNEVLASAATIP